MRRCVQGQATDIAIQAEEILKLKRQINNIYAKHTGQPLETIGRFVQLVLLRRCYMVVINMAVFRSPSGGSVYTRVECELRGH